MDEGTGHGSTPNSLGSSMHANCHVVASVIWPCDLGSQQLGSFCYACISHNFVHSHFA